MIRGIHYFSAKVKTKIAVIPRGCFNLAPCENIFLGLVYLSQSVIIDIRFSNCFYCAFTRAFSLNDINSVENLEYIIRYMFTANEFYTTSDHHSDNSSLLYMIKSFYFL